MLLFAMLAALAMLSKEQGITVLGVAAIYDLALRCRLPMNRWLPTVLGRGAEPWVVHLRKRLALSAIVGLLLLGMRMVLMGKSEPIFQPKELPHRFHPSLLVRALSQNWLVVFNCKLLVAPVALCSDWSYGSIPLVTTMADPRVLGIAMLYGFLCHRLYSLWGAEQSHQLVELTAWGFMALSFLPATGLFFTVGFVVAERVLYLPRCAASRPTPVPRTPV